jgi:hypothetical protein
MYKAMKSLAEAIKNSVEQPRGWDALNTQPTQSAGGAPSPGGLDLRQMLQQKMAQQGQMQGMNPLMMQGAGGGAPQGGGMNPMLMQQLQQMMQQRQMQGAPQGGGMGGVDPMMLQQLLLRMRGGM